MVGSCGKEEISEQGKPEPTIACLRAAMSKCANACEYAKRLKLGASLVFPKAKTWFYAFCGGAASWNDYTKNEIG